MRFINCFVFVETFPSHLVIGDGEREDAIGERGARSWERRDAACAGQRTPTILRRGEIHEHFRVGLNHEEFISGATVPRQLDTRWKKGVD